MAGLDAAPTSGANSTQIPTIAARGISIGSVPGVVRTFTLILDRGLRDRYITKFVVGRYFEFPFGGSSSHTNKEYAATEMSRSHHG